MRKNPYLTDGRGFLAPDMAADGVYVVTVLLIRSTRSDIIPDRNGTQVFTPVATAKALCGNSR